MSRKRRIRASAKGGYDVRLPDDERALIGVLPGQLIAALAALGRASSEESSLGDPPQAWRPRLEMPDELARLFPVAYPRDEEAQAAFAGLSGGDLLEHHRTSLELLVATSRATHLDEEQIEQWLAALNDLRLVLGTSLEVTEEREPPAANDPRLQEWICYDYLSFLLGEVVDALSGSLPPPVPGADAELPDDPWGEAPGDLRWDGTPRPIWP